VHIGMRVIVDFQPAADEMAVPVFRASGSE
jgi:hypothetical protein